MGTVATRSPTNGAVRNPTQVKDMLERMKSEIMRALPRHINAERMLRVMQTAIQRTPRLAECSDYSLCGALVQASQLGLECDGILGHAYLVPYKNKKTGKYECQLIPGYRGLILLARQSGEIKDVMAEVIYARDELVYQKGTDPKLVHRPCMDPDPGPMIGAYAVAFFKDALPHFELMWKVEIDRIRARSKAANDGPWQTDYEEMAKKTVVKRLCKWLPASVELKEALRFEADADRREYDLDVTPTPAPAIGGQSVLDQLPSTDAEPAEEPQRITDDQVENLADLATEAGVLGAKLKDALSSFGVGEIMDLTPEQADHFAVYLKSQMQ